jgi:allophanate hydrolase
MFNNVIGLKPTRGLLSTRGVLPACRTLDCVSIFAETVLDASIVLTAVSGFDELDPYSRLPSPSSASSPWSITSTFRFGVPTIDTREFFGDIHNPLLFQKAIDVIRHDLGGEPIEFDLTPLLAVASLLYKGPWVAERFAAVGHFVEQNAADMDPIVQAIIVKANDYSAADAFNAAYELERLKKKTNLLWEKFDLILVPTAPRAYTFDEIAAAPIECNSNLGYYTNFVNLLDLAAIAIPAGIRPDGLPFGVTLIGQTFTDTALALLADRLHRALNINIGGSKRSLENTPQLLPIKGHNMLFNCFLIAVVGAHLSDQPLNYQLTERKARLVRTCRTHPEYCLYVLKDCVPIKPGLIRMIGTKGPGIELEIWALPTDHVASFIDLIPPPLSIGNIYLDDGSIVKGFLVESSAVVNAQDITHMGGWRAYRNSMESSA